MSDRQKRSQRFRFLFAAGLSGVVVAVCSGPSASQTSEIDSYEAAIEAAVTSQSKAEALNFIRDFASSHLVGDLIASLPPAVAQQVCGDLQGGGPAKARKACASLRQAVAGQPLVPPAEIAPAGSAALDPVSAGASTPAGVLADDEPEGEQAEMAGTNIPYRPVTPAPAAAGTATADPVPNAVDTLAGVSSADSPVSPAADASAGISSDDEPEGELDAGDTDRAGMDLFYVPDAEASPGADKPVVDSVSTAADTSANASSDDEPEIQQDAGITDETDAGLLYLPATAVAPAAGSAAAAPESGAVTSTSSVPSDDEPQGGHGNGDRDDPIILQTANTVPAASINAVPSVSTSMSAPTGVPSVDEPDTSNAQSSSGQSSGDQTSSAQSGTGQSTKSGSTKSGSTKSAQSSGDQSGSTTSSSATDSSGPSSGDQSGSTQSGSDHSGSGKDKSDKGKGGKGKGGKDNGGKNKG